AVLKALFAVDLGKIPLERVLEDVLAEADLAPQHAAFARELAEGALAHRDESDAVISGLAVDWTVQRMAAVDRNILRLAVYEILHRPDIPDSVAVNEAVELAKKYGEAESGKFVNGILGELVRRRAAGEPCAKTGRCRESTPARTRRPCWRCPRAGAACASPTRCFSTSPACRSCWRPPRPTPRPGWQRPPARRARAAGRCLWRPWRPASRRGPGPTRTCPSSGPAPASPGPWPRGTAFPSSTFPIRTAIFGRDCGRRRPGGPKRTAPPRLCGATWTTWSSCTHRAAPRSCCGPGGR